MAELKSPIEKFNFDKLTFSQVSRFDDNIKLAFLNAVRDVLAPNIHLNGEINFKGIKSSQTSALRFYGLFCQEGFLPGRNNKEQEIKQDLPRAKECFKAITNVPDTDDDTKGKALSNLGVLYQKAGQPKEAERCFKTAIFNLPSVTDDTKASAYNNIGFLYCNGGVGFPPQPAKAIECYIMAYGLKGATDDSKAMTHINLGALYQNGAPGFPPQPKEAEICYKTAIFNLPGATDEAKAIACNNLASLYKSGAPGFPPQPKETEAYYQKAAYWLPGATADTKAKTSYNLGILYKNGAPGFPPRPEKALECFEYAINFLGTTQELKDSASHALLNVYTDQADKLNKIYKKALNIAIAACREESKDIDKDIAFAVVFSKAIEVGVLSSGIQDIVAKIPKENLNMIKDKCGETLLTYPIKHRFFSHPKLLNSGYLKNLTKLGGAPLLNARVGAFKLIDDTYQKEIAIKLKSQIMEGIKQSMPRCVISQPNKPAIVPRNVLGDSSIVPVPVSSKPNIGNVR